MEITAENFIRAYPLTILNEGGLITVINTSIWCCLASSMQRSFDSSYFCLIILTVQTFGPVTQSSFLQQMGIDTRMKVSGAHRPMKKSH